MNISKSSFIEGKQCLKAIYLYKHFLQLRGEADERQQAIFDTGHRVGELAQLSGDPGFSMIELLKDEIRTACDIIVCNKAFERGCLKGIARDFPEYEIPIKNIISRMMDLMTPFQKMHYYIPELRGSYSITSVLPALAPGFSYYELEINNGDLASY